MKLEHLIVVLLLFSVGVLCLDYCVPRTQKINYGSDDWTVLDSFGGKGSFGSSVVTERGLETEITLCNDGGTPYVSAVLSRESNPALDFTWFKQVKLKAYIVGKDHEFFKLFIRSRLPELYDPSVPQSRQYNEAAFKLTAEPQTFILDRNRFHVPTWWAEMYGSKQEHSISVFDTVDAIEISTGSSVKETSVTLVVEEIELSGNWISPIVLYRALLASWLSLAFGVMIKTYTRHRKTIVLSEERESRLRNLNMSLKSEATQLARLAHHDAVTGLLNRYGLRNDPRVATGILTESGPASLIVFDIDHFKVVNDTYGHNYGDQILADIGTVLLETAKENQLVARWGGEEFVVVCFGVGEPTATAVAESLREVIESTVGVTCSFGVSGINADVPFLDALDRSDLAMYKAKSNGRNCVVGYGELSQFSQSPGGEKPMDKSSIS